MTNFFDLDRALWLKVLLLTAPLGSTHALVLHHDHDLLSAPASTLTVLALAAVAVASVAPAAVAAATLAALLLSLLLLLLLLLLLSSCMAHMHIDDPCTGCTHRPMCMLAHTRTLALMHAQDMVVQDAHVHDSGPHPHDDPCIGHGRKGCACTRQWCMPT